jgi:hypothetical protein
LIQTLVIDRWPRRWIAGVPRYAAGDGTAGVVAVVAGLCSREVLNVGQRRLVIRERVIAGQRPFGALS